MGVAYWRNGRVERRENIFSLSSLNEKMRTPVQMDSKDGFPDDPVYFVNFCKEVSALYDQFTNESGLPMSALTFIYENGRGYACQWRGKPVPFPGSFGAGKMYEKTVKERIQDLFSYIAEQERGCQGEANQQLEVLSGLNPTELLILQKVVERGKSWTSQINRDIQNEALTKTSRTSFYIDRLCNTHIFQNGERLALLDYELATSKKYGQFQLYRSPVSWIDYAMQKAEPRPFTLDDLPYLTKEGKVALFDGLADSCYDEDEKRRVLDTLGQMPANFISAFAKSKKGEKFFRGFAGEETGRAKDLLVATPGCKLLANKYFLGV